MNMPTIDRRPFPSLNELVGHSLRSDQLLRAMHKVFSHDLPNQMVVLQSLLQFLDQEESAGLSDDGREYVRRLLNATKRAGDMVRFLKEMGRLNGFTIKPETISLSGLARELQGELQRLHPARKFEFGWDWNVPAIAGDARVFMQALLELFAGLLHPHGNKCRVSATSEQHGEAIELAFHLEQEAPAARPRCSPQTLEQRMEIILAREWLALAGAGVEWAPAAGEAVRFSIVVPNP